jgi:DNA helicase-2/ATP-dependent DNA helicase PcrA
MSFLDWLNPQQLEAVTHRGSPLLILAGAGSGKTRVITHRVAALLEQDGARPESILAVTFTNKAAGEMKERVTHMLSGRMRLGSLWMTTFHSACVRILRRDGPAAGIPKEFTIYDDDSQAALVKQIVKELGLDDKAYPPRSLLSRISHWKNHALSPEQAMREANDPKTEKAAVVYEHYQKGLRRNQALDFDDLLLETVRLLQVSRETALRYNERFQHVLVDEYQDTNRVQYELIRLLTQIHKDVCVVGDEDQSIYSWRGADIRNILEFERDFPKARTIRLEQNYRSTKNVLAAAGAVVARNQARKGKTLWTDREAGDLVGFYEGADAEQEALFIAETIARYLPGNPGKKVGVLYRTNGQSRLIEEALRRYRLRYHVVGGLSFYERAEIKDLTSYLRVALNPDDSISMLRILNTPPRGIGNTTVEKLENLALENNLSLWAGVQAAPERSGLANRALAALAEFARLINDLRALALSQAPVLDMLKWIIERTHFTSAFETAGDPEAAARLENIQELLNAAADSTARGEEISDFLDHAALVSDADDIDERALISLLTLHTAKGLEFSLVFLAGLEEGLFPHSRTLNSTVELEEERRLCYVGMTRAQDRLILTRAQVRRRYGSEMPDETEPSRFLSEVPEDLIADLNPQRRPRRERADVYDGPLLNSAENIRRFFAQRGKDGASALPPATSSPSAFNSPAKTSQPTSGTAAKAPEPGGIKVGGRVRHAKYGVGTLLRREGEGGDAKLTISFQGYGLKKLVEKYAELEGA